MSGRVQGDLFVGGDVFADGVSVNGGLSEWTEYTPTWTNLTVGAATQTHYYTQIGRLVVAHGLIELAANSTVSTAPQFSLPVTARNVNLNRPLGECYLRDVGTANYNGTMFMLNATTVAVRVTDVSSTYPSQVAVSATVPFTWTASDQITYSIQYEAA